MTSERLVCANCSGPVAEGRCPVCRSARQQLHRGPAVPAVYVVAAVAVLVIVSALLAATLTG